MLQEKANPYSVNYDLTNCDDEPIHIIRYIQPHALVIVCSLDLTKTVFISNNCTQFLNLSVADCLQAPPSVIIPDEVIQQIKYQLNINQDFDEINPIDCSSFHEGENYVAVVHINEDNLIVIEIEPRQSTMRSINFQIQVGRSIEKIQKENRYPLFLETAAQEIKKLTGFDRVMVYRFDEEGHGVVVAEALNEDLNPFLGIHYPATDVPKQARALFLKNKLRFISDLETEPAVLFPVRHPVTQSPFSQTYSHARGTSPIHVEYLLNMGVKGSMTVAIVKNNELWGLFACHHYESIWLDYSLRVIIKLMSQIVSSHLLLNSALDYKQNILDAQIVKSKILDQMIKSSDAISGLMHEEYKITDLFDNCGAVIYTNDEITTLGDTPSVIDIKEIILGAQLGSDSLIWKSNHLKKDIPAVKDTIGNIAGALILIISHTPDQQLIIWFRKEKKENVYWAGNPEKSVVKTKENVRLSPRKSFEKWQEIIKDKSEKWKKEETNIALSLRSDIKEFFLAMYNELRSANLSLEEAYKELDSFSYTVAHDLRAPLRSIKGFAQILEEDYEEVLGDEGKNVLNVILNSANKMNNYINDILNIAKLGRQGYYFVKLDIEKMIKEIFDDLAEAEKATAPNRDILLEFTNKIPPIVADHSTIRQLLRNVIDNAIKYTKKEKTAKLIVDYSQERNHHILSISDNGIGFDVKYKEKVFEFFSRLTSDKDFEGTGVGMAIAHKIISKHNGSIDCISREGIGTTFEIKIPLNLDVPTNIDL